jgi:hypothetical protein
MSDPICPVCSNPIRGGLIRHGLLFGCELSEKQIQDYIQVAIADGLRAMREAPPPTFADACIAAAKLAIAADGGNPNHYRVVFIRALGDGRGMVQVSCPATDRGISFDFPIVEPEEKGT